MARTPPEPPSFAQQLDRLEEIVRRLEAQVKQVLSDQAGHLKVEDFDG